MHLGLHLCAIAGGRDDKSVGAQELGNKLQDLSVIVDDKNLSFGRLNCGRLLQHWSSVSFWARAEWHSDTTTLLPDCIDLLQCLFFSQ
jgi:hypothetical protein